MKSTNTPVICILICLAPTLIAGQALQVQNQQLTTPLFQGTSYQNSRQMTDSPLLRLSNTGTMGEDGIRLELTSLPLLDPGPSIFMDLPDPMVPGSGAIRFQPNGTGSELSIYDSGTSGIGATLGYASFPNYYEVIYDMNGFCQTSYDDLHCMNTFIPDSGKYIIKVTSSNPSYPDFFLTEYKLGTLETSSTGNDLSETVKFLPGSGVIEKKVSSTNPVYSAQDFKFKADLGTKEVKESFNDLHLTKTYETSIPKLTLEVASDNPMFVDNFFDVSYNLDIGSVMVEHKNWKHVTQYNETDWDFITSLSSNDPGIPGFFDITYDISLANELKHWTRSGGTGNPPLEMRYEYDAIDRKIRQVNTDFQDGSFFDITYDFPMQRLRTECNNLVSTCIYSDATKHEITYTSTEPSIPSFFDITYDISLMNLQKHVMKAGAPGILPLELRYEYDGVNRSIREVCVDNQNGSTLTIERRLTPSNVVLDVGGSLEIDGTLSASPGPLTIPDNVIINGDLQVNGMFASFNKFFKIDHPLDPDNKYLLHSCVESPDMMNIYNGNAITDEYGFVTIQLPDYFEALNMEFRYQLTCIGQFAQAIIDKKVYNNQFVIRTDKPNVEVSWQITGIRQDPGAKQCGYKVEEVKEVNMKGKRLYAVQ